MNGKEQCHLLRQIRKEIAETNGIPYEPTECTYQGNDCQGTCPQCDAEIAYLDAELNKKFPEPVIDMGRTMGVLDRHYDSLYRLMGDISESGYWERKFSDKPLEELKLSLRTRYCLNRANIKTVGELLNQTEEELSQIKGFNPMVMENIIHELEKLGISWEKRVGKAF